MLDREVVDPERFQRIEAIFHGALEQPASERAAYLEGACGDDVELRAEVDTLLAADAGATAQLRDVIGREAERASKDEAIIGRRLGAYRLVEEIGRGGMGGVFLAVRDDDEYHTEVAVKLLPWGLETSDAIDRFRDERQILATLRHPGIVQLLDGGSEDGVPYLVMERIEGVPITEHAAARELSVRDRVALMVLVCDAVQYAHQHLVVHRDLKPSNILVTEAGEPKLLDFGIAKLLHPGARDTMAARTRTGIPLLTPEYAAPEQLRGELVSTATDVHALGVILFELVTGERLRQFPTGSLEAIMKAVVETEAPRPSTRCPPPWRRAVAGDLDNIVAKALEKDPTRRYPGAEQLGADLRCFLEGLPVMARAGGSLYRAGKLVRRHLALVTAITVVTATLIAATVVSVRQARRADRQAERADQAAARAQRRFDEVRRLARSLLFEIDGTIGELAGSTAARELIVTRALEYLDALAAEAGDDQALIEEVAAGYIKIGDIQGSPRTPNLGRSEDARASYAKALAVLDRLGADADRPSARWLRARAALTAADVERQMGGSVREVLPRARAALHLLEGLTPSSDEQRVIELLGHLQVHGLASTTGDGEEANVQVEQLIERAEAWLADDGASTDARYWLGVALEIRAETAARDRLDVEAGQRDLARAATLFEAITAQQPANGKYRRELARALRFAGRFHYDDGQLIYWVPVTGTSPQAEAFLRRALDVYGALAASDPDDDRIQAELTWAQARLGELVALHDPAEATRLFGRARASFDQLAESPYGRYNRAAACCTMVVPLARMGDRAALAAAIAIGEGYYADQVNVHALECAHRIAWARALSGHTAEAIATLEQLVATTREQLAKYPDASRLHIGLLELQRTLAEIDPARRCQVLGDALTAWNGWDIEATAYTRRRADQLAAARRGCPP